MTSASILIDRPNASLMQSIRHSQELGAEVASTLETFRLAADGKAQKGVRRPLLEYTARGGSAAAAAAAQSASYNSVSPPATDDDGGVLFQVTVKRGPRRASIKR